MPFVLGLCDPVDVLVRGRTMASGAPEQIQKDPAVVDAYLGDDFVLETTEATASRHHDGTAGSWATRCSGCRGWSRGTAGVTCSRASTSASRRVPWPASWARTAQA